MRNVLGFALLVVVVAIVGGSVGCTSNNKNHSPDLGCIPGTTECVDTTLARVCTDTGWLAKACPTGSMCTNGDCAAPTASAAPCLPGSKVCVGNSVLACAATGFGYTTTDCPANTNCQGGFCKGFCVVGQTSCVNGLLSTCTDGFNSTVAACTSGTACVVDNTTLGNPAICVKGDCTPDTVNGCNFACGIQGGPSPSPAATNFISTCTNTNSPLGFRWVSSQCQGAATCDPVGADCNTATKQQARCVTQCTPAAVRCAAGNSTQTCDANGNWQSPAPCAVGLVCGTATGSAICGNAVCVSGTAPGKGLCTDVAGVSELMPCVNGQLIPSPAPCTTGTCVRDTTTGVSANPPAGACVAECQTGDTECAGGGTQGCTANGLWSNTVTPCATGTCQGFTTSTGRKSTVCGACVPGTHQCSNGNADIALCGSDGQLAAATACTFGQCRFSNTLVDNACTADCVPGSLICVGAVAPSPQPGTLFPGTSAVATCTASGINPGVGFGLGSDPCVTGIGALPLGVACCSPPTTGVVFAGCRNDPAGNGIGCVTCVGSGLNEEGLVDTRCSDGATGVGTAAVQTCKVTNDGWQTPVSCSPGHCNFATPTPAPGTNNVPAGTVTPSCHSCPGVGGLCTETNWNNNGTGATSCFNAGEGAPMSCGNTSDCCSDACYLTNAPLPAFCGG